MAPNPRKQVADRLREARIEIVAAAPIARTFDRHLWQHLIVLSSQLQAMAELATMEET